MKTRMFLLLALFFPPCLFAQGSAEARKILDKAVGSYERSDGVRIAFEATTIEPNGQSQTLSGTSLFKGNKFKLETEAMIVWFDGKTQWVLMKDAGEVNISNPTPQEIASVSPLALIGMYRNGYVPKTPVSKTVNGKNAAVIEMISAGNNSEFKTLSVAVDVKTNRMLRVDLTAKNGTKTRIDISNYNSNYKFSDSDFVFDKSKHPGIEIVDLR